MARQIRIEYGGAHYHIMARGEQRREIVLDEEDRKLFERTLMEGVERAGWLVHAWVLMSNHYHLAIETPVANLVAGMSWMQNTFTRRWNLRHRGWGHLFGGRYRAILVDKKQAAGGTNYLGEVIDYIHLNPLRAGMVDLAEGKGLLDYPWGSLARGYAKSPESRPGWMVLGDGLLYHGLKDDVSGRKSYVEQLEKRFMESGGSVRAVRLNSILERGWYWGSESFREKLLKMIRKPTGSNRSYQSSLLHHQNSEQQAEELIVIKTQRLGISEGEMIALPNTDPYKMEMAFELATRTTLNQEWIARRLRMKSAANVSRIVSKWRSKSHLPPAN